MNPRSPFPPLGPGRPSATPGPAASPFAGYQAMQRAALARSVAGGERYLDALRVRDAASRASQLRHLTHGSPQDATRAGRADTAAFAGRQRYAAMLSARPRYTLRPGLTPEERLWLHTVTTMPYEMALMVRLDPVVRSVGGAVVTVGAATGLSAAAAQEVTAYSSLRWLGWRAATLRFGANATGQYIGGYALSGDGKQAFYRINWISPILSAGGVPLITSAIGSAGFKFTIETKYTSITNGSITAPAMAQDAVLSYGLGQATRLSGLDTWFQSPAAANYTAGLRYQISLRLSPRFATGIGSAIPTALEAGNRTTAGALRKIGSGEIKKHLPK